MKTKQYKSIIHSVTIDINPLLQYAEGITMETYNNCKTAHTGLYKPHTIYLNDSYGISIVYWKRDPKTINDFVCAAYDKAGNKYDIYRTKTIYGSIGFLAFPADPDKIKGFFPWL